MCVSDARHRAPVARVPTVRGSRSREHPTGGGILNPGPGSGGGAGIDGAAIVQTIVTVLVLVGVVLLGVLVLRGLGAIERAVRGETVRAATVVQAPSQPVPSVSDADQRAWQQHPPAVQADRQQSPSQESPPR